MRLAGTRKLRYADGRLYVGDRFSIPMDETGYSLMRWDAAEAGRGARGSVKRAIPAWNVLLNLFDVRRGRAAALRRTTSRAALVVLTNTSTLGHGLQAHAHRPGDARGRRARAGAGEPAAVRGHPPRDAASGPAGSRWAWPSWAPSWRCTFSRSFRSVLGAVRLLPQRWWRRALAYALRAAYLFVDTAALDGDGRAAARHGRHLHRHHRLRLRAPSGEMRDFINGALGPLREPRGGAAGHARPHR